MRDDYRPSFSSECRTWVEEWKGGRKSVSFGACGRIFTAFHYYFFVVMITFQGALIFLAESRSFFILWCVGCRYQ